MAKSEMWQVIKAANEISVMSIEVFVTALDQRHVSQGTVPHLTPGGAGRAVLLYITLPLTENHSIDSHTRESYFLNFEMIAEVVGDYTANSGGRIRHFYQLRAGLPWAGI